jgi:uncharacterized repeat protein (TIGR03806 family)
MKYIQIISIFLVIALSACGAGSSGGSKSSTPNQNSSTSLSSSASSISSTTLSSSSSSSVSSNSSSSGSLSVLVGLDARPSNTTCLAPEPVASGTTQIQWQLAFTQLPGISNPSNLFQLPGDDSHWYVMRQAGYILRFQNTANANQLTTVLDIDARVDSSQDEMGLLGFAIHPNFSSNRFVFLYYTGRDANNNIETRVARFTVNTDGVFNASSETILLRFTRPYGNHVGGQMAFDNQGYLLISSGDGGSSGDPHQNGQNRSNLLGKILRIDVDRTENGLAYAIPADNPFVGQANIRAEIWAYGLRNPWRFSVDSITGDLWVGDVGQGEWEEINLVTRGGNYGWGDMEGDSCYSGRSNCSTLNKIKPVHPISHNTGACSVIGGFVYRGSSYPAAYGRYFYTDYCETTVRSLVRQTNGNLTHAAYNQAVADLVSFAEDNHRELYAIGRGSAGQQIVRMNVTNTGLIPGTMPTQLSATGCVQTTNPKNPASGMIPYDVKSPLWSDGVDKSRYLSLPNNTQIEVTATGDFNFPVGSVLMKHFIENNQYIETRLFAHTALGWQGFSYEWNDQQTDATLLSAAKDKMIGDLNWHYPSAGECLECHTAASGFSLGLETAQLNHDLLYAQTNRMANQLTSLQHIQLFKNNLTDQQRNRHLYSLTDDASLEQKAKSYLHSNCSHCHQPNDTSPVDIDLRFNTLLNQMGVCNQSPQAGALGIPNPLLIAPGEPLRSVLLERMKVNDANKMPKIGRNEMDQAAVSVMSEWVGGLSGCN